MKHFEGSLKEVEIVGLVGIGTYYYGYSHFVHFLECLAGRIEVVVAESRASSGGKYVSYSLSVRLKDREEMARLDAAIASVPGLKMCL